jgi:hypothetical protein
MLRCLGGETGQMSSMSQTARRALTQVNLTLRQGLVRQP